MLLFDIIPLNPNACNRNRGQDLMGERFKWIKEHAGLWTFGILMVVVLTALCGLGAWALAAQDAKQLARNNILKTNLTVEVKRLDGDIADLKNVLQAVSGKIDRLDIKIDRKIGQVGYEN